MSSGSDFRYGQEDVEAVEEWSTENSSPFQPIYISANKGLPRFDITRLVPIIIFKI